MATLVGARAEKRDKILDAAIKVFARKGFHQSRVTDIAQEAGVADGTIYLYFRNKDDLLISIFKEKMAEIVARTRHALVGVEDASERLRLFIAFHLSEVERNRSLAEIFQVELRLSSKFMKEYEHKELGDYLEILASIVRDGQSSGVFRPDVHPAVLKRAIFGALDELSLTWVLSKGRRHDLTRNGDQLAGLFLRGVLVDPGTWDTSEVDKQ